MLGKYVYSQPRLQIKTAKRNNLLYEKLQRSISLRRQNEEEKRST